MRKNKFLALFLTVCMMLTSIGTLGIVASAEDAITKSVNVPQNVTYTLPATVNEQEVTWSPMTVDTSKIGYKLYTGTLEDNSTVTYRVNVGEWKTYMYDEMENLYGKDNENVWADNVIKVTQGSGFVYRRANNSSTHKINAFGVKESDDNYAVAFGPELSTPSYMIWWPKVGELNDEYKISYKVKVSDYNLLAENTSGSHSIHKMTLGPNTEGTQLWVVEGSDSASFSSLRLYTNGDATVDIPTDCYTYSVEDGILNTDYIEVNFMAFDNTYSVKIGDTELISQKAWKKQDKTFTRLDVGKSTTADDTPGTSYFDDFSVSRLIYVTDTLENASVNETLVQGDPTAQTATVTLNMSDKTTKDFTVKYTADTSSAGVKQADGTIDGFDGTVPVTYTVTGVTKQTINTYIGAEVVLADGRKVDTTKLGRQYKRVEKDGAIIDYTINVGSWDIKRADDMSRHTNTAIDHDNNEETDAIDIVSAAASDGFPMTVYTTSSTPSYAVVEKYNGDQALKFTGKNNADHIRWNLKDGFDGSFKYSMRVNVVTNAQTIATSTGDPALNFKIYNTQGQVYFYARLLTPGKDSQNYQVQVFYANSQASRYKTPIEAVQRNDGKWETGYFTIDVIGKADTGTRDIYVNGELIAEDLVKYDVSSIENMTQEEKEAAKITDCTFNDIRMYRDTASIVEETYVDDVSVSSYYKFEGDIPTGEEVLIGQGQAATGELPLTFSNGIIKNIPITVSGIDTAKLGTSTVKAALEGFDETVTVNAKVCNYHINALGFKEKNEYISAPKAGGAVSDAIFTNMGNYTQAKAVFAWYNSLGKLESSKIVDLSGIAKGETKKINVGLQLPESLEGGMLKVFVLDSLSNITPIDVSQLFASFTATAPTVYMTGDSTTCDYKVTRFPEAGVGQMFGDYLSGASVVNMARSGLSSQTFIDNGYWDTIMNNVKPGDYIFITFGHNDLDDGTFQINIPRFAQEAAEKNANIIMYSPVARRLEALKGTAWDGFNYGGQMDFMKQYCKDNNIPYIDMTTLSQNHIKTLGEDKSAQLYMVDVYSNYKNYESDTRWSQSVFNTEAGRTEQKLSTDNSHFTFFGADTWAQMLAKEIKNMNLVLSDYIVNADTTITYPNLD